MGIGDNVAKYRKERGYTQSKLAEMSCISRTYLADIERGRNNPSVETLIDIAKSLNVPISLLFGEYNLTSTDDVIKKEALSDKSKSAKRQEIDFILDALPPEKVVYYANVLRALVEADKDNNQE